MQVVASANHNEKQSLPALALSMLLGSHLSTFAWKAPCFAEPTIDEASTHGELCFIFGNVQNCKLPTCLILFNVIFYLYCTRENYKPVCKLIYIHIFISCIHIYAACNCFILTCFQPWNVSGVCSMLMVPRRTDASHFVPRRFAVFFVSNPICKILVLEYRDISTLVL